MNGPCARQMQNYARHCLALKSYLEQPGDGRQHPHIPARDLLWSLIIASILRAGSFARVEWLVHSPARTGLGVKTQFSDDTLAYFTERLDAESLRLGLIATLKQAKRNKAFENSPRIGLALDGTGAGYTHKQPCELCHPVKDGQGVIHGYLHHFAMLTVVGAGLTLPFDVEPYGPRESEYGAGRRLLKRALTQLGPRFADYLVADGEFAKAPFLHQADELGIPVVIRLKDNLPDLHRAVLARFAAEPPHAVFQVEQDRVEIWDADDFDPWETLDWQTVRALRYRQHKPDGKVVEAEWLTNFTMGKLPSLSFYRVAKSRWEIENQGFNDGKNRYGMEHIRHHEAHSLLIVWLILLLALVIERLYRTRYLHRGAHGIRSAIDLKDYLWLGLTCQLDSS